MLSSARAEPKSDPCSETAFGPTTRTPSRHLVPPPVLPRHTPPRRLCRPAPVGPHSTGVRMSERQPQPPRSEGLFAVPHSDSAGSTLPTGPLDALVAVSCGETGGGDGGGAGPKRRLRKRMAGAACLACRKVRTHPPNTALRAATSPDTESCLLKFRAHASLVDCAGQDQVRHYASVPKLRPARRGVRESDRALHLLILRQIQAPMRPGAAM